MSQENTPTQPDDATAAEGSEGQGTATFALRSQFIKDLSFENPRAPGIYASLNEPPAIDVKLDLQAQRLSDTIFELTIHIGVRATHEKQTVFLVDLAYAGLFEAVGIHDEHLEQAILVQGAFLLFPYARRIVSDITRDGGFPALNLEPIDFFALYQRNRQQAA